MKTSTEGLMALIGHEGIVLTRYLDSVGVWTIAVGHTAAAGEPNPKTFKGELTVGEALELLRKDIAKYEAGVNKAVKVPLQQHQFDALVSFHFNTGAIARASLTKSINAGQLALASEQFMNWTKPKEITARRKAERDLFVTGQYPAPFATIFPATPDGKVQWSKGKRIDLRKALVSLPTAPQAKPPEATDTGDAQTGTKPNVVLVDGPKADETTVVVVQTPDNPPINNPMPTSKRGFAVFGAMILAIIAAVAKYFGG